MCSYSEVCGSPHVRTPAVNAHMNGQCVGGKGVVSAEVGEDDRLDGQPADWAQFVPLLQLPGADVAGHKVSGPSVHDAAILWSRLTDEAGVQAWVRQTPLCRNAALHIGDLHGRRSSWSCSWSWGRWEKLLRINAGWVWGRGGLGFGSPELLLWIGGGGRLGAWEDILGVWCGGGGVSSGGGAGGVRHTLRVQRRRSF